MKSLFKATPTLLTESKQEKLFYMLLVLLTALGQFLCASGSGAAAGNDAVAGWVHTAMNVANTSIGILIFIPKTRALAALLSGIISALSMTANDTFYDFAFFIKRLPFDGSLFSVSVVLLVHYWPDLRHTLTANPS